MSSKRTRQKAKHKGSKQPLGSPSGDATSGGTARGGHHMVAGTLKDRSPHPLQPAGGRRSSWSSSLLAGVIFSLAIVAIGLAGHRVFHWLPMSAFRLFFYSAASSAFLAFVALVTVVYGLFKTRPHLIYRGLLAMVLGLVPAAGIVVTLGPARIIAPAIHDITTDTTHPPAFVAARVVRTTRDNSANYGGTPVATIQHEFYPQVQPILSQLSTGQAFDRALNLSHEFHWKILRAKPGNGTIEAIDRSRIFGFIDDIAIRITAHAGGSRIDIRSASRQGLGDFGANALRIMRFLHAFGNRSGSGTGPAGASPKQQGN